MAKIIKGLLTGAKYCRQDPHLTLLTYRSTPVDALLHSPTEMLYQRTIWTTVPQKKETNTPMLTWIGIDSMTELCKVHHTMTNTHGPRHHSMLDRLYQY